METVTWETLLSSEPRLLDAAKKLWPSPTLIQQKVIPLALEGKDILARAQTGSGKTASYIIPILIGILRSPLPWSYKALILVPTRELCKQVKMQFEELSRYCHISITHLGDDVSLASQRVALTANPPAIIIRLDHGPDIEQIISKLPSTRQSFLMSATLGDEIERLQTLVLNCPVRIDIQEESRSNHLMHYYIKVEEQRKYEVFYALLQNRSIGRRILLFVNNSNNGYRVRLFLERFSIKSSVLNSQLPVASRIHILQEFNRGGIDVLVAIDEDNEIFSHEFSASRGIDFQNIDCVINFEVPKTIEQYIHRVGRTARGMKEGIAITFINNEKDIEFITEYLRTQENNEIRRFDFNVTDAEIFRYRVSSVLESITKTQIKSSKRIDIKRELLNSERLKSHFEENPADLQMLKHDSSLLPSRVDKNLRVLPDYLGNQIRRQQKSTHTKGARSENEFHAHT
ncbi:ATP-dependent RNA helicase dbp9 [Histomonas meleagridis]|uniref:ATP-dependent RNA helicase dbp9 n=1 Tax=Histomonas meleagridis TaxID=135588 RepID=UPI003559D30A|nr:ATP-dependent RNA helicase dbp9 [Histomonas meleagridis]